MKVTLTIDTTNSFLDRYVLREELQDFKNRLESEYDCKVEIGKIAR